LGFCKPWVRRGLFKTLTPVPGGLAFSLGAACVTVEKGQKTSSALRGQPIEMGTVVSGEMSVQGNLEGIDSVGEVIMIAREYGAVRIALPSLCELDVSNVPGELTKNIEIVYYDQPSVLVDRVLSKRATESVASPPDDVPGLVRGGGGSP